MYTMIQSIKQTLFKLYNNEEQKGLFMSWFDSNHQLLFSHGVVITDKPLHQVIDIIYKTHVKPELKNITYIACDVVTDLIEFQTFEEITKLSPREFWFLVVDKEDDLSGILLPNTAGVQDTKSALAYIKKKYGIHGQVEIVAFRTERIVITK